MALSDKVVRWKNPDGSWGPWVPDTYENRQRAEFDAQLRGRQNLRAPNRPPTAPPKSGPAYVSPRPAGPHPQELRRQEEAKQAAEELTRRQLQIQQQEAARKASLPQVDPWAYRKALPQFQPPAPTPQRPPTRPFTFSPLTQADRLRQQLQRQQQDAIQSALREVPWWKG